MEYLVVKVDSSSPVAFPILKERTVIGRDSLCDIFLSHSSVSREHGRIIRNKNRLWIEDNNSLNGTFVNGKKVSSRTKVKEGDDILFGNVETRLDSVPSCRSTITKTIPWTEVDKVTEFGNGEEDKIGLLDFVVQIGEALDHLFDEEKLLANFARIFHQFLNAFHTGFFINKNGDVFEDIRWFKGDRPIDGKKNKLVIEKFDTEMVLEGAAYIAEMANEPLGRNSRLFIPLSFDNEITGFIVCISPHFNDNGLIFGAVISKLLSVSLLKSNKLATSSMDKKNTLFNEIGWVGKSRVSQELFSKAIKFALGDSPVVIYGESGTGKELVAKFLAKMSQRNKGPFIVQNCAALSERIAESELFGHVKGAFTDAIEEKKGLLEQADKGIVFLDEIGDLPLSLQAKLLRAIETKRIRKVGSEKEIDTDFRVICATNRVLARMVDEGKFRLDLFYRIQVLSLSIPPVRSRKEDIIPLIDHYLLKTAKKMNINIPRIDKVACDKLTEYSWPGNVRELKNVVERTLYLHGSKNLTFTDFEIDQDIGLETTETGDLAKAIVELEKKKISKALLKTKWNKKRAAEILGISRQTLDKKIVKYEFKK